MNFQNYNPQLPTVYPQTGSYSPQRNGFKSPWQATVSQCTQQTGLGVAACAHNMAPLYNAAQEQRQSRSRSSSLSGRNGLNSYPAAYTTLPYYQSQPRTPSPSRAMGSRSRRDSMSMEPVYDRNTATTFNALQVNGSPRNVTKGSYPENRSTLNSDELRRVARALGLSDQGETKNVAQAIRERVGSMSPRTQQYYSGGGLSPRSMNTLNRLY